MRPSVAGRVPQPDFAVTHLHEHAYTTEVVHRDDLVLDRREFAREAKLLSVEHFSLAPYPDRVGHVEVPSTVDRRGFHWKHKQSRWTP